MQERRSHTAELSFRFADEGLAAAVGGSLAVEAREGPEGSMATVRRDAGLVTVHLEAESLSDLRAALNSCIRLLDAASKVAGLGALGRHNR